MRIFKRISGFIAVLLVVCMLMPCAFAEEYDLAIGSVTVEGRADGTYVTQLNNTVTDGGYKETTPTVIYQSNSTESATSNSIRIDADFSDVSVTIKDVNLLDSTINIFGDHQNPHDASVTFEGTNNISIDSNYPDDENDYYVFVDGPSSTTIQGADSNASLNISNSKSCESFGICIGGNTTVKDINVSINGVAYGIGCEGAKLSIDNSNIEINANNAAVVSLPYAPEIVNSAIVIPESGHIEKMDNVIFGYPAYTIVDSNYEIAKSVKIERSSSSTSNIRYFDDKGVHEGKSFAFIQDEESLINIICNGKILVKGTDYTVEKDGQFLIISFTDEFYASFGNGPMPILVNFKGVSFSLSVVNN